MDPLGQGPSLFGVRASFSASSLIVTGARAKGQGSSCQVVTRDPQQRILIFGFGDFSPYPKRGLTLNSARRGSIRLVSMLSFLDMHSVVANSDDVAPPFVARVVGFHCFGVCGILVVDPATWLDGA